MPSAFPIRILIELSIGIQMPSAFKLSYWVLSWREEKSKRKYSMCGVCHGWFGLKLLRNLIHVQRIFFNIGQNNSSLYVAVRMIHNSILQRISVNAMPKYGHCIRKKKYNWVEFLFKEHLYSLSTCNSKQYCFNFCKRSIFHEYLVKTLVHKIMIAPSDKIPTQYAFFCFLR